MFFCLPETVLSLIERVESWTVTQNTASSNEHTEVKHQSLRVDELKTLSQVLFTHRSETPESLGAGELKTLPQVMLSI